MTAKPQRAPRPRLADARKKRGLTQQQAADALAVDRKTINRWERGGSMTDEQLQRLADLYGLETWELLEDAPHLNEREKRLFSEWNALEDWQKDMLIDMARRLASGGRD